MCPPLLTQGPGSVPHALCNLLCISQLVLSFKKPTLLFFLMKQKSTCILNDILSLMSFMKSSRLFQYLMSSFSFNCQLLIQKAFYEHFATYSKLIL